MALIYHPDKNKEMNKKEAETKFIKISEAYKTLSNPILRKQYDEDLHVLPNDNTHFNHNFNTHLNTHLNTNLNTPFFAWITKNIRGCKISDKTINLDSNIISQLKSQFPQIFRNIINNKQKKDYTQFNKNRFPVITHSNRFPWVTLLYKTDSLRFKKIFISLRVQHQQVPDNFRLGIMECDNTNKICKDYLGNKNLVLLYIYPNKLNKQIKMYQGKFTKSGFNKFINL